MWGKAFGYYPFQYCLVVTCDAIGSSSSSPYYSHQYAFFQGQLLMGSFVPWEVEARHVLCIYGRLIHDARTVWPRWVRVHSSKCWNSFMVRILAMDYSHSILFENLSQKFRILKYSLVNNNLFWPVQYIYMLYNRVWTSSEQLCVNYALSEILVCIIAV